jgi:hypothetical protein
MAMFQKKVKAVAGWVKSMPEVLNGRAFAHVQLDGHFTPASGARMARMFPLHAELRLTYRRPGVLRVEGTLDVESNLDACEVSGELHLSPWCSEPFLKLAVVTAEGVSSELVVPRLGKDFLSTRILEGRMTGAVRGDLTLRVPAEQFMRVLRAR